MQATNGTTDTPFHAEPPRPAARLRGRWRYVVVFVVGLIILLYPVVTQWYYATTSQDLVIDFDEAKRKLDRADIARRIDLAQAYNETLDPSRLADPYTARQLAGRAQYARMLEVNELLGHIEVPRIGQDIPVYAGTSDAVLQKGAGHLEGTSLPIGGTGTHAVITAHRGLPTARLFSDLDQLQLGDVFLMHNVEKTLAYRVNDIIVVEPTDFSQVIVQDGHDSLTLLTCTPYMVNSHRLLVRGERIPLPPHQSEPPAAGLFPREYFLLFAVASGVIVIRVMLNRRRAKGRRRSMMS